MNEHVPIVQLDTGVPGLNEVLGGGLPEYSFNLLAGGPGAGKTTLAQQICFALATPERPALYITVLGEPPVKLLRYQHSLPSLIWPSHTCLRFVSMSPDVLEAGLGKVLEHIVSDVEATNPGLVVVDSFRSVIRASNAAGLLNEELSLQAFVQRLALHLTAWQATTFLIGEYQNFETEDNPVFTVADGILWLYQSVRAEFHRSEAADREDARASAGSWLADVSHYQKGRAGLSASADPERSQRGGPKEDRRVLPTRHPRHDRRARAR